MQKFEIENRRYLGSKTRLLPFIEKVISKNCKEVNSIADLFAGTGVVGAYFNSLGRKIIFNDILYSNYLAYIAWFGEEIIDLEKLLFYIKKYNETNPKSDNYFSNNFSDTYFSKKNCRKIGFIREDIEKEFKAKQINFRERAFLITSLLYAMDHIANTVGHYDAFRLNGNLDKELVLKELDLENVKKVHNEVFNLDANVLIKSINPDLVYIDPPYNSRQYCDAYHVLENVARWEKPNVVGVARKMDRSELKSKYCMHSAPKQFDQLVMNIQAKYILVSYNNMGTKGTGRSQAKITDEQILKSLSKRGKVKIFEKSFNAYTTGKSDIKDHKERLFLCIVDKNQKNKRIFHEEPLSKDVLVKSPLNYTGGKFKLLPQLLSFFPSKITSFVDLFGGGFNVGANIKADKITYNDIDYHVVDIIKLFKKHSFEFINSRVEELIERFKLSDSYINGYGFYGCDCSKGLSKYNKPFYENLRNEYNIAKDGENKVLLLLTLIIFSFNNQIRFNSKGEFNMPIGKRDYNSKVRKNFANFSKRLKQINVFFSSKDFRDLLQLDKNSFVYCDPPYLLGTASYNENKGWTERDEKDLLDYLLDLDKKGIKFALSNLIEHKGKTNILLKNWAENNNFKIKYVKSNYTNSNYHIKDKNSLSKEVLIINY